MSSAPVIKDLGEVGSVERSGRIAAAVELTKPRLNSLVLFTTFVGFVLASQGVPEPVRMLHTLVGSFLVAGGAAALNQAWERSNDARMSRTRSRPLPSGRLELGEAILVGVVLSLVGLLQLAFMVNGVTALLGLGTWAIYLFLYTPMKTRSVLNTVVGAVSGALPPVMGWTAVTGRIDLPAVLLFGVLFFWQHPHFFALAWRCREDYERGGFVMLPHVDESGWKTGASMVLTAALLLPLPGLLSFIGTTGSLTVWGGAACGLAYLWTSSQFFRTRTNDSARRVFLSSLLYLPVTMGLMLADRALS